MGAFGGGGGGGGGGGVPLDHYLIIVQHENRDFNVFHKNVFLTLRTDNQANTFFSKTLLYEKENK